MPPHSIMKKNLHHPPEEIRIAMAMDKESRCSFRNHHTRGKRNDYYFPPKKPTPLTIEEMALQNWTDQPQTILRQHPDPTASSLILASRYGDTVSIHYHRGHPALIRQISPEHLFIKHENSPIYIRAFCHHRNEMRTFRLDRINLLSTIKPNL